MKFVQKSLLPAPRLTHGGALGVRRRKTLRPLDPKRPVHLVLRSERARGGWSLLHSRHRKQVAKRVAEQSARWNVRVYRWVNVGNHLHLLVKGPSREHLQNFLRTLPALLARDITGARKGRAVGRFWTGLAFSRVVAWGEDFASLTRYLLKNRWEALGLPSEMIAALRIQLKAHTRGS